MQRIDDEITAFDQGGQRSRIYSRNDKSEGDGNKNLADQTQDIHPGLCASLTRDAPSTKLEVSQGGCRPNQDQDASPQGDPDIRTAGEIV